jgi:hypothetical protein
VQILNIYSIATRMELNVQNYFFFGLGENEEDRLMKLLPFKKLNFQDGFKYLSYILKSNVHGKRDWDWDWLMEKVGAHINI